MFARKDVSDLPQRKLYQCPPLPTQLSIKTLQQQQQQQQQQQDAANVALLCGDAFSSFMATADSWQGLSGCDAVVCLEVLQRLDVEEIGWVEMMLKRSGEWKIIRLFLHGAM